MINCGANLKYLRECAELKQPELAKKIGTSQANISRWERGDVLPNIDFCVKLANFYGITVDELLEITPDDKAAGATATRRVSITPIEDDLLYAFRRLGKKHGENTQRGIIEMIEKML